MTRNLRCSFCGRSEHQVAKLVAGPRVFICDACIQIAASIIDAEGEPPSPPGLWARIGQRLRGLRARLGGRRGSARSSLPAAAHP